jgi:3-oxoacyl-[acyl-carrier-protein] synthase II
MTRRVVITGVGMVTPVGNTAEDSWTAMLNGKGGVTRIPEWEEAEFAGKPLPVTIAARVKDFDPKQWIEHKDARRMDVFLQFAMAAASQAWTQSGLPEKLDDEAGNRCGAIVGVGLGGIQTILHAWELLKEKGPRRISPFFIPGIVANMAPGYMAIKYNIRGANWAPASACSSGGHGIGEGFEHIRSNRADVMLVGGAEAGLHELCVAGFASMHALCASKNDDPATASRPFDKTRDGFVMGEGAGMMVIEELEHAKARGANILAEIVGYGSTGDAHHITTPAPEGEGAQRAMRDALKQAEMNPDEVGYINAHDGPPPRRRRRCGGRHQRARPVAQRAPADDQSERARPRVRPRLHPAHRPRGEGGRGHVELLRLRGHRRGAALQALRRLSARRSAARGHEGPVSLGISHGKPARCYGGGQIARRALEGSASGECS